MDDSDNNDEETYKYGTAETSDKSGLETPKKAIKTSDEISRQAKERKSHFCEFCDKSFCKKQDLKTHIRYIHEGIKDFECYVCGKAFLRQDTLEFHIKSVHEKLKDQQCEICPKSFSLKATLKWHIKNVHEGIKEREEHNCVFCKKSFGQVTYLKRHIKAIHEGLKDQKCNICKISFNQKELKKHSFICKKARYMKNQRQNPEFPKPKFENESSKKAKIDLKEKPKKLWLY